ncbi:MAG: hypothetical protein Gaeavirus8_10 [Gaeavirus sp.]|uniref:F-box and FNIP repeat-containing protein n=1 Tax=Gaeavirus sp. TaxID=2487767 RepID=A0A3G5A3P9_9VIRU|nr:MAG: hypothetical protein Gaeavirus8_10 [Gaeavirus sp.]
MKSLRIPSSVKIIIFGNNFDQPVDIIKFPETIEKIVFGYNFNQPIDNITFPEGIRFIKFGWNFNQPVIKTKFPSSLRSIHFGWKFNQSLDNLPDTIEQLFFEIIYSDLTNLPLSVKEIILGDRRYHSYSMMKLYKLPYSCIVVDKHGNILRQ